MKIKDTSQQNLLDLYIKPSLSVVFNLQEQEDSFYQIKPEMDLEHTSKLTAAYNIKDTFEISTTVSHIVQNVEQSNEMSYCDEAAKNVHLQTCNKKHFDSWRSDQR